MNLKISAKDVLSLVKGRLSHLVECREFLNDFLNQKLDKVLIAKLTEKNDTYDTYQGQKFLSSLASYQKLCQEHAQRDDVSPNRAPVERLQEDIDELEAAEQLVCSISHAMGHYNDRMPREMGRRLDNLTHFDDSE